MIMCKYLVTIHEDGHLTAIEYEEPSGFVYSAGEGRAVWSGYNQALRDVSKILDAEKTRCEKNRRVRKSDQGWLTSWTARVIECELIKASIEKLFYPE